MADLPPLPDGFKMITQPAALPPLPTGFTMLTDHKPPKPTGPVDMGPQTPAPSESEQALRGAYSPVDALLTLFEHQLGASGGAVARLGAQATNHMAGVDIPGTNGETMGDQLNPDAIHDAVSAALGGNRQPVTSQAQTALDLPGKAAAAINATGPGKAVNDAVATLAKTHPNIAAFLGKMGTPVSDAMNTIGVVAGGAPTAATDEGLAASQAAGKYALPAPPIHDPVEQLKAAGYKIPEKAEDVTGAQANNPGVTADLARRAAGLTPDQTLTTATLNDAKKPHNAVLGKVESDLGPAVPVATDPDFQNAVNSAGSSASTLSPKNPLIDDLKAQALSRPTLSGTEIGANIRQMRDSGYRNIASDDDGTQALGRTQLDIAQAHEGLIDKNLPADSDVSLADLQAARQSLAKINMVQRNLVGEDVNPAGVAREARGNPAVNGELRLIANLQDLAPKGAQMPTKQPLPKLGMSDLITGATGALAGHAMGGAPGAVAGTLMGAHNLVPAALEKLRSMFTRPGEAPADLNAAGLGDLFTRGNDLPANWGREAPADLSPAPAAPLSLAPDSIGHAPAIPSGQDQLSLADLLSHGVEQPGAAPLSVQSPAQAVAARSAPAAANFVPSEADRLSGGLSLGDAVSAAAPQGANTDLGHVMSQGVPEGIMSRTAHPGGAPLTLEPSQARGAGFGMNPISSEPSLADILEGVAKTAGNGAKPTSLPPGASLTADVHRGVPKGASASDSSKTVVPGTLMYTPDHATAAGYAGTDGTVESKTVNFKNALDVGTLPHTIAQLGLSPHANIADVITAAKDAGYDGLRYSLGGMNNDIEIVDLKPKKGK